MSGRLDGKLAFITGIGGGQGRVAALRFAAEGATVVGCDIDGDAAARTADLVREEGGEIASHGAVNLADRASAKEWIDRGVAEVGSIDILYNNAGAVKFNRITDIEPDDWSYTLRNEIDLVVWTTQAAWPHLIARGGGSIVNISSTVALRGHAVMGIGAHCAAKAALIAFTCQTAAEGSPDRIRANSICPGGVETPALAAAREAGVLPKVPQPLGRIGRPEDIVDCALYLASDEASWVTAANVVVDGGMSLIDGIEPTEQ
jgi:NAD(P)-dependent dehydrogenase (short-subunit alcohol dehydrogenase family)